VTLLFILVAVPILIVATVALHDLTQRRHAIKLAQGAKPGTGGWLPKEKITHEIAAIRGIPMGVDCQSPNGFDEFHDAPSLLEFIARVRRLTAKPVGLKLVVDLLPKSRTSAEPSASTATGRTSLRWTAKRAAPAPRRWRSSTTSGCL